MLKITTYQGSIDELVNFVNVAWADTYAGKMTFPSWTADFFRWQFQLDSDQSRQNLIAAYDDEILVGVLLGTDYPFRSPAGLHAGSQWSWLSIHPEYRSRGIAKALDQERINRQQAAGSRLIVGFRYVGSRHSKAERPRRGSANEKFNRKIGFWARVLDPARFAKWHWNRLESVLASLVEPFTRLPRSARTDRTVRTFRETDLDDCVRLARQWYSSPVLAIAWDHDSLRRQLSGCGVCQTLVLEEDGRIGGFVNFHILSFHAKTIENVAVIDMIVFGTSSSASRIRLLNAALARMIDQGAILALKLRSGDVSVWPMLATHFVPKLPDSYLVLQSLGERFEISKRSAIHVLWR